MRIPLFRPWRAFEEFDHLSDAECEKLVGDAWVNSPPWVPWVRIFTVAVLFVLWPAVLVTGVMFWGFAKFIPVPRSGEMIVVMLSVTTVVVSFGGGLVVRDLTLYMLLKRELSRAECPRCRQSLRGLPVQSVGVEPDPTKNFVRCTECGRVHKLMDLGITPRDLVPFEQRRVPPDFAKIRR